MEDRKITDMLSGYLCGESPSPDVDSSMEAREAFDKFIQRKRVAETALRRRHIRIVSVAVAAIAAALAVFVIPASLHRQKGENLTEYVASAGEIEELTLPDSSLVWLNSSSRLTCASGYGVSNRNLTLEGEAYFDVVKDSLPFVVSTGRAAVKVLGTAFNLRDYPEEESASVSLFRGSVSFGGKSSTLVLEPGQSAVLRSKKGKPELLERQIPASWKDGVLYFDDCPMEQICRELSRVYGIPVTISDKKLKELRFSAELSAGSHTLEETLEVLSLTNRLKFRKSEEGYEVF